MNLLDGLSAGSSFYTLVASVGDMQRGWHTLEPILPLQSFGPRNSRELSIRRNGSH